jgi:hypothetical protein
MLIDTLCIEGALPGVRPEQFEIIGTDVSTVTLGETVFFQRKPCPLPLRKLLVVDDSPMMRRIIISAASVVGAECVEARDGRPRVPANRPLRRALKTLPRLKN